MPCLKWLNEQTVRLLNNKFQTHRYNTRSLFLCFRGESSTDWTRGDLKFPFIYREKYFTQWLHLSIRIRETIVISQNLLFNFVLILLRPPKTPSIEVRHEFPSTQRSSLFWQAGYCFVLDSYFVNVYSLILLVYFEANVHVIFANTLFWRQDKGLSQCTQIALLSPPIGPNLNFYDIYCCPSFRMICFCH